MKLNKKGFIPVLVVLTFIPNLVYGQGLEGAFIGLDQFINSIVEIDKSIEVDSALFFDSDETNLIIEYALEEIGKPYVYGKQGPEAFDCSGLTSYIYKKAGITIPRVSSDQGNSGILVENNNLKPGDLVFFDTRSTNDPTDIDVDTSDLISLPLTQTQGFVPSRVTHVGIYLGQNKFIHASSGSDMKVVIADLDNKYFSQRYLFARRYL